MELNTASAVMGFARKLEEDEAKFFETLAQRYPAQAQSWSSFIKENMRYASDVERAYYGVISDALEGCFTFKIMPDDYAFNSVLPNASTAAEITNLVISAENKITRFYNEAAAQSKSLLAEIPRVFTLVAKKRSNRKQKLIELLESARP